MTTDIFIKTCNRDQFYHVFCIQSINRFCSGFNKTVVVCSEHPRGYLEQQVVKLHADLHCDADFILVTDSDTLFTEPVTPESFMRDGKPIWFHTPWTKELIEAVPWHPVMEQFFGEQPPSEFMRRQPFMFPREVLKCFRDFCEVRHGRSIGEYVHQKGAFSEYNILGMYCWLYHHEKFAWINTETDEMPAPLTRQFWSHDPLEKNLPEIKNILA